MNQFPFRYVYEEDLVTSFISLSGSRLLKIIEHMSLISTRSRRRRASLMTQDVTSNDIETYREFMNEEDVNTKTRSSMLWYTGRTGVKCQCTCTNSSPRSGGIGNIGKYDCDVGDVTSRYIIDCFPGRMKR